MNDNVMCHSGGDESLQFTHIIALHELKFNVIIMLDTGHSLIVIIACMAVFNTPQVSMIHAHVQ